MVLGVDVGGTKTIVATFSDDGDIISRLEFATSKDYTVFLEDLQTASQKICDKPIDILSVALPGRIDRDTGIAIALGNLPWENIEIVKDLSEKFDCQVVIENDANVGCLFEANYGAGKDFSEVLYLTVSTGIGTGYSTDGVLNASLLDSEGGQIIVNSSSEGAKTFEELSSGKAFVSRYGDIADNINDEKTWSDYANNLSLGINDLIRTMTPDAIVIGGSIGANFPKFEKQLDLKLAEIIDKLSKKTKIVMASQPKDCVILGTYHLATSR